MLGRGKTRVRQCPICKLCLRKARTGWRSSMAAIEYARCRYISRSNGGSATRSAAYDMRGEIVDERTQQLHKFLETPDLDPSDTNYRLRPVHHEVLLPEGAPAA